MKKRSELVPWLKAITEGASEYGNGFMRKVWEWDEGQCATDGHVIAIVKHPAVGLEPFPRLKDCKAWFSKELTGTLDGAALRKFCDPFIYAKDCRDCKGTVITRCETCEEWSKSDRKHCDDCGGTEKMACEHIHPITNLGFIKHVLFNRSILWKVLGNVSDKKIQFHLGTKEEMIRLNGKDWMAAIMPMRQDGFTGDQLKAAPRFQVTK